MANYTHIQSWFSDDVASSSKTLTLNFTPAPGSLLLMFAVAPATFSTPSGWTRGPDYVGTYAVVVFTKTATGSETTVSWSQNAGRGAAATIYEFPPGTAISSAGTWTAAWSGSDADPVTVGITNGSFLRVNAFSVTGTTAANRLQASGDLTEDDEHATGALSESSWIGSWRKDFTAGGSATLGWTAVSGNINYHAINYQLAVPASTSYQGGMFWPPTTLTGTVGGAAGTTILSGTATPGAGVGNVGDYYLDTDDNILYGPKPPAATESYVTPTLSTIAGSGVTGQVFGAKFQFLANGTVTGIRIRPSTAGPMTGWEVYLWKDDGTLLASKDAPSLTAGTWNLVNFDTPVSVTAGPTYVVGYWVAPNGEFSVGGSHSGLVSGNVSALANATFYSTGPRDSFPTTTWNSTTIGISPVHQSSGAWPVAVQTADTTKWIKWTGTQAQYDAIVTKDANTLYVII